MNVEIWHNPKCSKSRAALELLERSGRNLTVIRYLETPPTAARLEQVLALLGIEPRALMRTKEPEYEARGLDDPKLSRKELIRAMVDAPVLIERPIVITERGAVVARPPERVNEVL